MHSSEADNGDKRRHATVERQIPTGPGGDRWPAIREYMGQNLVIVYLYPHPLDPKKYDPNPCGTWRQPRRKTDSRVHYKEWDPLF